MISTDRVVTLSASVLPLDRARTALLPVVRLAREGAVTVARTVRHWELALEGTTLADDEHLADLAAPRAVDLREQRGESPLPVEDWAELSFADAQARLTSCDDADLRSLLEYERTHGHRPQYTLLLEQKLALSG